MLCCAGVALAAIGMLATLATGLTIDAYGPVCDNAGGIAEMAQLPHSVREKTDALDAAGIIAVCLLFLLLCLQLAYIIQLQPLHAQQLVIACERIHKTVVLRADTCM